MITFLLAMSLELGDLTDLPDSAKYAALPRDVRILIDRRMPVSTGAANTRASTPIPTLWSAMRSASAITRSFGRRPG